MTQNDLFNLIIRACYAYHDVYGKFPSHIRLHRRWDTPTMWNTLTFPHPAQWNPLTYLSSSTAPQCVPTTHTMKVVFAAGTAMKDSQVALYHPDATDWISAELVFLQAGVSQEIVSGE